MEMKLTKPNTTAELVSEIIQAGLDHYDLGQKEKNRPLVSRERAAQGVAAMKLIVYGAVLTGLAVDQIFANRQTPFTRR